MRKTALFLMVILASASMAFAHANYIGYSGAPGAAGQCAASCHGTNGGTIQVTGFPSQYSPGQVYTIAVSHSGGSSMRQFNASVRVGTGSQNAGTVSASTGTAVYNTGGETNGIHLMAINQDNGTFLWTGPSAGTGLVKLYLAGLQGAHGGQNSSLVLTAAEHTTGINDGTQIPDKFILLNNYPNPFNAQTRIEFTLPIAGRVSIEIYNALGQKVENLASDYLSAGEHSINWNASSQPSGVYFCRLTTDTDKLMRRITLLK